MPPTDRPTLPVRARLSSARSHTSRAGVVVGLAAALAWGAACGDGGTEGSPTDEPATSGKAGKGGKGGSGGQGGSAGKGPGTAGFPSAGQGGSGAGGAGGAAAGQGGAAAGASPGAGAAGQPSAGAGSGAGAGGAPSLPCDPRFSFSTQTPQAGVPFQVTFTDPQGYPWIEMQAEGPGSPSVSNQVISGSGPYTWSYTIGGHAEGVLTLRFYRDKPPGSAGVLVATCQRQVLASSGQGGSGQGGSGSGGSTTAGSGGGWDPTTPCDSVGYTNKGQFDPVGDPVPDPAKQADLNPRLRGWEHHEASLQPINYDDPAPDCQRPRINTLFADQKRPAFLEVFKVHRWDWGANKALPDFEPLDIGGSHVIRLATTPGMVLSAPAVGRVIANLGAGDLNYLVLFVEQDAVMLKNTAEDNIVSGYGLHIYGICPDPALRDHYNQLHAQGRAQLPAVPQGQPLGRARSNSVIVIIRDTGAFMDGRAHAWWSDLPYYGCN